MGASDPVRVAARHFLSYRREGASSADGTYWISRIPFPILMIRDEADAVVKDFEPNMLMAAAKSAGSIVPRIDFVSLSNPLGPSPRGHAFADTSDALLAAVVEWLNVISQVSAH
jgi:hypothetical protein